MAARRIFISYDHDSDETWKDLLMTWSRSPDFADLSVNDLPVTMPVDSADAGEVKRVISAKLKDATGFLCIVGKQTHKNGWVHWEIERAVQLRRRIIAVKIDQENVPPAALLNAGAKWTSSVTLRGVKKAIDLAYAGRCSQVAAAATSPAPAVVTNPRPSPCPFETPARES